MADMYSFEYQNMKVNEKKTIRSNGTLNIRQIQILVEASENIFIHSLGSLIIPKRMQYSIDNKYKGIGRDAL